MIINATTGAGFGGALAYIHKKDVELTNDQKPIVLEMNHVYGEPEKQAKLMRDVAKENSRSSRPVLHLSISFSEDEKLSPKKVEEVLHQVIKEYGATAENNQYVIVKHNDASHEHYHILLNKVGFDGKNIDTSYIQNKSHAIADKIEKEQSLVPTQGRTIFYDPSSEKGYRFASKEEKVEIRKSKAIATNKKLPIAKREQEKVLKQEIQNKVIDVLQSAKTPQEFKEKLAFKNVEVNFKENVNGISGVTFTSDKLTVKGSDVRFKWGEIKAILTNNLEKSHAQNIDMPIVQPPVQQSFKAEQKAKDIVAEKAKKHAIIIPTVAKVKTATEKIAEKMIGESITQSGKEVLKTAKTPEEFKQKLAEKGITVDFTLQAKGISGVKFTQNGISFKGSDIGLKASEVQKNIADNLEKSPIQNIDKTNVQAPRQVPELLENEEIKENMASQALSANDLLKQYKKTTFNKETAPGATPTPTPAEQEKAKDLIAREKWLKKYFEFNNEPESKGLATSLAVEETFKLALEMKASMPKLGYNDMQIADQAIRLSMRNYEYFTLDDGKPVKESNPWGGWDILVGKEKYIELLQQVEKQKQGEIPTLDNSLDLRSKYDVIHLIPRFKKETVEKTAKERKKEEKRARKEEKKEEKQQKGGPKVR
jgi:hypothetical protein